jgi:hypothetical protein
MTNSEHGKNEKSFHNHPENEATGARYKIFQWTK